MYLMKSSRKVLKLNEAYLLLVKKFLSFACFMFQYGRAPIHWASSRGNTDIMELLIAARCDIEARDKVRNMTTYSTNH